MNRASVADIVYRALNLPSWQRVVFSRKPATTKKKAFVSWLVSELVVVLYRIASAAERDQSVTSHLVDVCAPCCRVMIHARSVLPNLWLVGGVTGAVAFAALSRSSTGTAGIASICSTCGIQVNRLNKLNRLNRLTGNQRSAYGRSVVRRLDVFLFAGCDCRRFCCCCCRRRRAWYSLRGLGWWTPLR